MNASAHGIGNSSAIQAPEFFKFIIMKTMNHLLVYILFINNIRKKNKREAETQKKLYLKNHKKIKK